MQTIKATARINLAAREAELFFHDGAVRVSCYAHIGQHSEACRAYYSDCTEAPRSRADRAACDALVREWNSLPGDTIITRTTRSPWER